MSSNETSAETFEDVMIRIQHLIFITDVDPKDKEIYNSLLVKTVHELTMYGLKKEKVLGIPDPDEEFPQVVDGLDLICQDLALLFNKTYRTVETDMMKAFADFPTEDIKLSYYLSKNNKLH